MILMQRSKRIRLVLTVVSVFLVTGLFTPVSAQEPKPASSSAVEGTPATSLPGYVYSQAGRRDPFVPLIQKIRKKNVKPEKDKGPLEKFELSQFRLVALLIVRGVPRAMVKAPDGKSYTVKLGDPIGANGGIVKRIETKTVVVDKASGQSIEKNPDRIVVEETGIDSYTGKEFKDYRYIQM
ncbi:MAG: pilus assembly protein PilP [Deltaproteobacteria bacterium]|nr:pilus assembly protein PilP [Deltaproteobacteria bacterium]